LSVAKATHSQKTLAEVSSSAPHLLQGTVSQPHYVEMSCRVLCPVSRPVTALDCVLLKDSSRVLAVGLGPDIS